MGSYQGQASPVQDVNTSVCYLDIMIPAHQVYSLDLYADSNQFIYVFEGNASVADQQIAEHSLVVLDTNQGPCEIQAGETAVRLISVAGQAIGESVGQYGPFVMNSKDEIDQAMLDYQTGKLVQTRAPMKTT